MSQSSSSEAPVAGRLADYLLDSRKLLAEHIDSSVFNDWCAAQWPALPGIFSSHGAHAEWEAVLESLPAVPTTLHERHGSVTFEPTTGELLEVCVIEAALRSLLPWRKGPFNCAGVAIDAEWRSDQKWARVAPHLEDLSGRRVLDVGCGNGYYLWRMLLDGARIVLGLDPGLLALTQFRALRAFQPGVTALVLPLASAALDRPLGCFDSVFSMGVLYHRRDHYAHLRELGNALDDGGQLILETLVIDSAERTLLTPAGRYARMRNVWALPSPSAVLAWLEEVGFRDASCVDITATTASEQRSTDWMPFQSLPDFLDPRDSSLTIEGHPAPVRAVFTATGYNSEASSRHFPR